MNLAILNDLAPVQVASKPVPLKQVHTKKHVTAAQAAQFLREREGKGLAPVERINWVLSQVARGIEFGGCGADGCQLGIYVGAKYARVCHRCQGAAVLSTKDKARYNTWRMSGDNGTRRSSYHQHNETNAYSS